MPLSDIQIRNLKSRDKPYKVSDFEGLFVLVKVSGSKSWRLKYRLNGKEGLLVIGDYPAVSLAQARKAREMAKALLAEGIDPNEAKQKEKRIRLEAKGHTFAKVGEAFLEKQRSEGKSKATLDKTEYHLKLANRDFGRKPITEITAPLILKTLRKVEAKGTYETAHRLRARIGSVFRYAVASGIAETDPTYALRDALIRPTRVHRAAITDPKALGQLMLEIDVLSILKREVVIREAWTVGLNDPDGMAVSPSIDPIIPEGQENAPIVELMEWKKKREG